MKKTTISVLTLLIMGTAAFAQEKKGDKPTPPTKQGLAINTTRSNIKHPNNGLTTTSVTPTKQEQAIVTSRSNIPKNPPAKVTTATGASTGKATGK